MSRRRWTPQRSRLRAVVVAVAAAGAAALSSACAAGQIAQTANQKSSIDGSIASVGDLDLRAVAVEPPPDKARYYRSGDDARLKIVIVNGGQSTDRLTGITTPAATSWTAYPSEAAAQAATATPSQTSTPASSASTPDSSAGSSASTLPDEPSGASTPSGSLSGTSAASAGSQDVPVAAGRRVSFGTPDSTGVLLLTGLTRDLYPAGSIRVTFTFAKAGAVAVQIPIQLADVLPSSTVGSAPDEGDG